MFNLGEIFLIVTSTCVLFKFLKALGKTISIAYFLAYLQTMFQFIHGMLTSEVYEEKIVAHVLASHEQAFRLNKAKDLYLAYISYISNQFYPYTLARSKRTHQKSDQLKFVAKNFNKIIFNDVNISRESYISNTCYIGEQCSIGVNV